MEMHPTCVDDVNLLHSCKLSHANWQGEDRDLEGRLQNITNPHDIKNTN